MRHGSAGAASGTSGTDREPENHPHFETTPSGFVLATVWNTRVSYGRATILAVYYLGKQILGILKNTWMFWKYLDCSGKILGCLKQKRNYCQDSELPR